MSTSSVSLVRSASKRGSVEKPRPLKSQLSSGASGPSNLATTKLSGFEASSVGNTLSLLENVALNLSTGFYDATVSKAIVNLSASLKSWGPHLEVMHKQNLDKCQVTLRNACRGHTLSFKDRLHIVEILELRAFNWKPTEYMINYYKQKFSMFEQNDKESKPQSPNNSPRAPSPYVIKVSDPNLPKEKKKEEIQLVVPVGNQEIKLSGYDPNVLKVAKAVLQRYFEKIDSDSKYNALQRSKSVLCSSKEVSGRSLLLESKSAQDPNKKTPDHKGQQHSHRPSMAPRSKSTLGIKEVGGDQKNYLHDRKRVVVIPTRKLSHSSSSTEGGAVEQYKAVPIEIKKKMPVYQYDRKRLLELASRELSQKPPKGWDKICTIFPKIAKKEVHGCPLPLDWEATFIFSKKSQYSEHCDREENSHQKFGHDSRA